jgi:hypothetical protein
MKIPWKRRPAVTTETTAGPTPVAPSADVVFTTTEPAGQMQPPEQVADEAVVVEEAPPTPTEPRVVKRRGLIPSWVPWAAGGTVVLVLVVAAVVILATRTSTARVPSLVGLNRAAATTRAKELGLVLVVRDTRFSATIAAGSIIDQIPVAGTVVAQGSTVRVDLSAGSETFAMPDVVGQTLDAARRTLRDRGLDVQFQTAASDAGQGTVISSVPSAGATVTTGATVRLTVAAGVSATDTLLPSDLSGLGFVLDAEPPPTGATSDVSFDIARRVRALLETAGARVTVTRAVTDTTATAAVRLARAKESTSTALVGLFVAQSGLAGLQVQSVPNTGTATATFAGSTALAQALFTGIQKDFSSVTTATATGATVLEGVGVPAGRVRLGSNSSNADQITFSDPQWADNVASDIYRALARTYGRR